ncbi:winged helix-turn-helix transcriptional regulator [uncultured Tenacibaculum sp.]|uniref:winged helix-turn-helix transcriptional regulator n=1 Tax=uncultured Tenacibaculum sp. TaxID=174713 RepID=UPI00262163FB|nr:winged helix-turn-helix transcriptional regulator [uncultured Tenacibaculum sp.]
MPEISEKMLIQELKKMTSSNILNRKAYPEIPPRVEYSLTDKGLKVLPILEQIKNFGMELMKKE